MAASYKIKISARLRPPIPLEISDDGVRVVHAENGTSSICVTNPRDTSQIFKFPLTSCYDQYSTQEEIFKRDVEPIIDVVYQGVTVTIFAYGVTSSGKTHTMQGNDAEPGIIPRAVKALLLKKDTLSYDVSLAVSYMEIYKDEVYDLLVNRESAPKLPVRENDAGKVFVANLTSLPIETVDDFGRIYSQATRNRSVGSTNLNRASSRSHAVLTITVSIVDHSKNTTLCGKLNLVDLAGSENNKLTGNDPSRMAESAAINKSLSVLGQVVHALNQGASRIPYRNSKLTRILQDALGGQSVGLLICNLAPGVKFRQDTLNTLNFAVRTKNIENKPVINEQDNRPVPKPHFAALQPPPPKAAPVVLAKAVNARLPRPSIIAAPRPSSSTSRVPRYSAAGPPVVQVKHEPVQLGLSIGLTAKEIDERIAKAVELEVARRLAEREREMAKEEARRIKEEQDSISMHENSLPSGLLTPLLHRRHDLDEEIKTRLQELERKFENGNRESQIVDVLSPVSRKKQGRAYVALARMHSEKNNLQLALELYRKAETYVPDNLKLKERIIELEWAVKHDKPFQPSPKRKKSKSKKSRKGVNVNNTSISGSHSGGHGGEGFGGDDTGPGDKENSDAKMTGSSQKRQADGVHERKDGLQTPRKKQRISLEVSSDDDLLPVSLSKGKMALI